MCFSDCACVFNILSLWHAQSVTNLLHRYLRTKVFPVCTTLDELFYFYNWQITQNLRKWCFRLDLAYILLPIQGWCRNTHPALMSMYMTDTCCSFTRNFIFKSCFLLSEYGKIVYSLQLFYINSDTLCIPVFYSDSPIIRQNIVMHFFLL